MEHATAHTSSINPARFGWAGWTTIIWRTMRFMGNMDTTLRCAGVAFFGFPSIFPAAAIAMFLVGLFASRRFLTDQFTRLEFILPDIAIEVVAGRLESLLEQPPAGLGIGLAVSIIVALWSGSRGINALIHTASTSYPEVENRNVLRATALSITLTLCGALFLIVALSLIAALPAALKLVPLPGMGDMALLLRWPVLLFIAMAGISVLYRYTRGRRPARLRLIWPGAALASLLWLAVCLMFSLYVENFGSFEATFGSLAAAVVLLLWLYISAIVVVLGSAFNAEIERQADQA